jgi:hypothetical protein
MARIEKILGVSDLLPTLTKRLIQQALINNLKNPLSQKKFDPPKAAKVKRKK